MKDHKHFVRNYCLEFTRQGVKVRAQSKDFEKMLQKTISTLAGLKNFSGVLNGGILQLILVNDGAIRSYNLTYRGVDKPTDVVSLSYFDDKEFDVKGSQSAPDNLIGEIIISVDTARKQAKEHKKTLLEEMQFLFIHGVLHVFGFDHEEKAERKVMFDLQDKIIGDKSWRPMIEKAYEELA